MSINAASTTHILVQRLIATATVQAEQLTALQLRVQQLEEENIDGATSVVTNKNNSYVTRDTINREEVERIVDNRIATLPSTSTSGTTEPFSNLFDKLTKEQKDALRGPAGKDGLNGKDGIDGKGGKDGIDGKDGKDGIDGKDGKDGVDGKDGKIGKTGKAGKNGRDGKPFEVSALTPDDITALKKMLDAAA